MVRLSYRLSRLLFHLIPTSLLCRTVITAAGELGIVVLGYSPLGRGFLTGKVKTEDLGVIDFRKYLPRFQEEVRGSHHISVSLTLTTWEDLFETDAPMN